MAKKGTIWGGWYDPAKNNSCDVLIANMCGQVGYDVTARADAGFWAADRRHERWLAFNSMMKGSPEPTDWQRWINPIPESASRFAILPDSMDGAPFGLYDIRNPAYAAIWATYAKMWAAWIRRRGGKVSGIFIDSICWAWWWRSPKPDDLSQEEYRAAQVKFCKIVRASVAKANLKLAANVGVGDLLNWPEITQHLDLIFLEHRRLDVLPDSQIANPDRAYRLGVHVEALPASISILPAATQTMWLRAAYNKLLGSSDIIFESDCSV